MTHTAPTFLGAWYTIAHCVVNGRLPRWSDFERPFYDRKHTEHPDTYVRGTPAHTEAATHAREQQEKRRPTKTAPRRVPEPLEAAALQTVLQEARAHAHARAINTEIFGRQMIMAKPEPEPEPAPEYVAPRRAISGPEIQKLLFTLREGSLAALKGDRYTKRFATRCGDLEIYPASGKVKLKGEYLRPEEARAVLNILRKHGRF